MTNIDDIGYLDYDKLKQYGLEYIQQIAHKNWSDYNLHDPGVTFLEALCFSLVDLGYRTQLPIQDLLTLKGESTPSVEGSVLFPADQILSFNPTTIEDYRKLILECVPGVRNVKIRPVRRRLKLKGETDDVCKVVTVKGYYSLTLELEDDLTSDKIQETVRRLRNGRYVSGYEDPAVQQKTMKHYVKNLMYKHRNLCEDVYEVKTSEPVTIGLCMELELEDNMALKGLDDTLLCQKIYDVVSEYVSPHIKYHTISELLQKGKTPADIFAGTIPRLGFIDSDELAAYDNMDTLHISDIVPLLLQIDGVKGVRHIHFKTPENSDAVDARETYVKLNDPDSHHFVFSSDFYNGENEEELQPQFNEVVLSKDWYMSYAKPQCINRDKARGYLDDFDKTLPKVSSRYRNTNQYRSFQEFLPECYHMGQGSRSLIEAPKGNEEKLQLKAYLTFFDQLLADYLAQLDSIQRLFSLEETKNIDTTYFHHHLTEEEICGVNMVLEDYKSDYMETDDEALERHSRLLDHLMARFNDSFSDYAALSFALNRGNLAEFGKKENVEDKKRFLKNYPEISGNRAKAQDVTESWEMSGVEQRILSRLGLNNVKHKHHLAPHTYTLKSGEKFYNNSSDPFEKTFGLHIIEHMLMVPADDNYHGSLLQLEREDDSHEMLADPYSFRVTAVLPGWLDICQNQNFRNYVESVIREEIPAHIIVKICWIAPDLMRELETAYEHYLELMKEFEHPEPRMQWKNDQNEAVIAVTSILNKLVNIYPQRYDKNKVVTNLDGNIILDFQVLSSDNSWRKTLGRKAPKS